MKETKKFQYLIKSNEINRKDIEHVISKTKLKYKSILHFIEVAVTKLIDEEKKAIQKNKRQ